MNVFFDVVNMIGILLELLITVEYFKTISVGKRVPARNIIFTCGMLAIVNSAEIIFIDNQTLTTFLMIASIFVIAFLYKLSVPKRIIFSAILVVLLILSEMLIGMFLTVVSDSTVEEMRSNLFFYIQGVLISKLFMFVVIRFFGYFSIKSEIKVSYWLFVPFVAMPIATFLVAYVMSEYMYRTKEQLLMKIAAISVIALIISNVLLFYLFELQIKNAETKTRAMLLQQQIQDKADYYKELAEKQRLSNKTAHDLKNQLFALEELIKKDPVSGKEELKAITDKLLSASEMTLTGIDSIDALITAKQLKMREYDICFTHRVVMPKHMSVQPLEFCIVLGNLLDNAIEANEKVAKNDRFVSLSIAQKQGYLSVQIGNAIAENVKIHNNEISTTKRNKEVHGFGIQSVKEITEKYNGTISFEQKENIFIASVILSNG